MTKNVKVNNHHPGRTPAKTKWAALILAGLIALIGMSGFVLIKNTIAQPVATAEEGWDFGEWEEDDDDWDDDWADSDDDWDEDLSPFSGDGFGGFGDVDADFDAFDGDSAWNDDGLLGGLLSGADDATVVAEFNGGVLTLGELVGPYNDRIAGTSLLFGEADGEELLRSVMTSLIGEKIARLKAEELGLTAYDDEDRAEIARLAQAEYESYAATYRPVLNLTGLSAQEADEAVAAYLKDELGVTLENLTAARTEDYWKTKLFNAVTSGVTATDDEIQEAYQDKAERQRAEFEEYPEDYAYALLRGDTVAWNVAGYRRVKHILLGFGDADTAARVEALYDEIARAQAEGADVETLLGLQEELNPLFAIEDAEAEEILAMLNTGADFDTLIGQYGDDPNMLVEPWKTNGYAVGPNSTYLYSDEFVDASLSLEAPGQVSMPAHSASGTHIIRYLGDTAAGAVPLEDIRAAIQEEVLGDKRAEAYEEIQEDWMEEANVKLYVERVK